MVQDGIYNNHYVWILIMDGMTINHILHLRILESSLQNCIDRYTTRWHAVLQDAFAVLQVVATRQEAYREAKSFGKKPWKFCKMRKQNGVDCRKVPQSSLLPTINTKITGIAGIAQILCKYIQPFQHIW